MTTPSATVPASVRTAFALFMATAAVSAATAVAMVHFNLARPLIFANPVVELVLYLAIGLPMRAGKRPARLGLFSLALLLVLLNLSVVYGLSRAFGDMATYQVVLLMVLAVGKVALLAAASWMMFRPQNQLYFR